MNSKKVLGSVLLSMLACIWGGMFVVVKIIVDEIHPIQLVWLRYLIAIIFLMIFSLLRREKWHWNWSDLRLIFLIGLIGNTISIVAQETGTWLSSAQTGAVITSATPTFMLIFAWLILKEKMTSVKIISVIMATLGVIMIVGLHLSGNYILYGVLSLIVAALTWALMSVLVKKVNHYSSLQTTIISTMVAIVCLTPIIMLNPSALGNINFLNIKVILCLFYLGVISTAMAFVMWNQGLKLVNASSSGLFFLLQPIVGTLLGWLLLGESISISFIVGTILIIGSVWFSIKFTK
ncbi:DMT family transporter [Companilactobacillus zhachilii]|uniref:DMT family transporter n=1 Tax=Companilactobacillus zhachilii TaxID=2304606 RepID=A0A386PP88_9LACO|nr:DMT family transporter [Companilactobacillus zhachilii]AYE37406.1 DMT family transporter [Companilactobacillus zhachilii]